MVLVLLLLRRSLHDSTFLESFVQVSLLLSFLLLNSCWSLLFSLCFQLLGTVLLQLFTSLDLSKKRVVSDSFVEQSLIQLGKLVYFVLSQVLFILFSFLFLSNSLSFFPLLSLSLLLFSLFLFLVNCIYSCLTLFFDLLLLCLPYFQLLLGFSHPLDVLLEVLQLSKVNKLTVVLIL